MDEAETGEQQSDYYAVLNVARDAADEEIKKSYRHLAQLYHPDKVSDASASEAAAVNFRRIQEAYEVLSNEEQRTVYDVYGKQGLEAGMEIGQYSRNPEELKREFEQFRAQQAEQRREASVAHSGAYIFKVDACELVNPYDRTLDTMPELTSVATTNSVQIPVSDKFAASVGCQVAVRKRVGGGSFMCGIKKILSPYDTVECHGAVGLKTFASVQATRRLSNHSSATVAASWHPEAGLGLSLISSRQLNDATEADWTWQVGPDSVMGMGITRRGERLLMSARLETGASLGIMGKIIWQVTATTSLRASAKLGTMGIQLELGGRHQVTEFSTAGCSVVAGIQGIILKPRFSRGGHVFEVPVMLSPTVEDYKVLAAAYVLPPLLTFVAKYYIIKPLKKRAKVKKVLNKRLKRARELQTTLEEAAAAAKIIEPVAVRKLRREVDRAGLVVVSAKYGAAEAIREAEVHERMGQNNGPSNGEASPSQPDSPGTAQHHSSSRQYTPRSQAGENDEENEATDSIAQAVRAALPELPPAYLDVTIPVRFLVENSTLHFHKGVSKSGLMGFCDAALGDDKVLIVHYLWQKRAYTATFQDRAEGRLPEDGYPVPPESPEAELIRCLAEHQGLQSSL